jgi:hypothetical protein
MRKLPQQADETEAPEAIPVYFFAPKNAAQGDDWLLLRTNYPHELNFLDWWAWRGDKRPEAAEIVILKEQLPSLPAGVKALGSGQQGTAIYWTETGSQEDLTRILDVLEKLRDGRGS